MPNIVGLGQIADEGRVAARARTSPAANPYFRDMHNERLDAWLEGYNSVSPNDDAAPTSSPPFVSSAP